MKWNTFDLSDPPKDFHANKDTADHEHECGQELVVIEADFRRSDDLSILVNVKMRHMRPAKASSDKGWKTILRCLNTLNFFMMKCYTNIVQMQSPFI